MRPVLAVALACAAGLVAGLAWPPPPIPRSQLARADDWVLPSPAALDRASQEAMQAARTGLRWVGDPDGGEGSLESGPWKLMGLVEGPEPTALVSHGAAMLRLAKGDILPDGRRVEDVQRDRITVDDGSCRETYRLYRSGPIARSGSCAEQTVE